MASNVLSTVKQTVQELSTGGQVVKKILLTSNALVFLFGLLLIIVGGVAAGGQFDGLTSTTLASGIIVIGFFVMIIALMGAWGSMTENKRLLYVYFGLLCFFAIIEFAVGIAAYVKKDDLPALESAAWSTLYNSDTSSINDLEKNFQCCGWYNISDRSVPPFGTEKTCNQLYPTVGACSTFYNEILEIRYGNPTDVGQRAFLENYQETNKCCGWNNLDEPLTSFWQPLRVNTTLTCHSVYPQFTQNCSQANATLWYANYAARTPAGDQYILDMQNLILPNGCCGWNSVTDAAVPPYSNNTCILTKGFNQTCSSAIETSLANSLQITGGIGIALGILELVTIALALFLIFKIPNNRGSRNDNANTGVMEELHDEE